jgi:hypothetical protein
MLHKVVDEADVIPLVLDARDPAGAVPRENAQVCLLLFGSNNLRYTLNSDAPIPPAGLYH